MTKYVARYSIDEIQVIEHLDISEWSGIHSL